MSLPRPPISANTPIPNQPFSADEVYYLEGNQGRLPLGNGLYIDPETGDFTDINPGYIYCTPQYGNLPVTLPPYNCETEVNTAGVTNFTGAWGECDSLTEFPCVDTSSGTDFDVAWYGCNSLTSFPTLNFSKGTSFIYTWRYCESLTSFPLVNVSKGENFIGAWANCYNLETFPALDFSSATAFGYQEDYGTWENCESLTTFPQEVNTSKVENMNYAWAFCYDLENFPSINTRSCESFYYTWGGCESLTSFPTLDFSKGADFGDAWNGCISLTSFPASMFDSCSATNFDNTWYNCALSQQSVNNILVSLDTAGQSNGFVSLNGGTSAAPSGAGATAKTSLQGKGWTVITN